MPGAGVRAARKGEKRGKGMAGGEKMETEMVEGKGSGEGGEKGRRGSGNEAER